VPVKKDLYEILGVARQAKTAEIRRAYQKLARRLHPDVNPGDREAHRRYREIQEAYRVLSRRQSRDLYDHKGETDPAHGKGGRTGAGKGHPLDSKGWEGIVRDVFHNDAEGEGESGSSRGEDIQHVLEVSFEESLKGAKKVVSFQREMICPSCRGRRFAAGAEIHDCHECAGEGLVLTRKGPYSVRQICRRCVGTGEASEQPCGACSGRGRTLVTEKKKVSVQAGSDSGTRVVFPEAGHSGRRGGADGNLVVTVRVRPDPAIERRGYNLYCSLPLTVTEAALGATILVPTPGEKVSLQIPAGTQGGQQFRLAGRGVALPGGNKKGDFYVTVRVVVPQATDPRARSLFLELEKLFPENPRVKA
jgi:molecular chaperone DnaJ